MAKPRNPYFPYFRRAAADFGRALAAVRTKKAKGKPVHDLRVNSRKLRVLLRMGDPRRNRFRKLERKLKAIGRLAGAERELEVAQEDAADFQVSLPRRKQRRRKARRSLRQAAARGKYRRLPRQLVKAEETLRRQSPPGGYAPGEQLAALSKWGIHPPGKPEEFHRLRIDLKKARYALESRRARPRILQRMQKTLGKAHDLEVLAKITGRKKRIGAARRKLESRALAELPRALRAAKG